MKIRPAALMVAITLCIWGCANFISIAIENLTFILGAEEPYFIDPTRIFVAIWAGLGFLLVCHETIEECEKD